MPKPCKTDFDDFLDLLEDACGKPFVQRRGDLLSLHFNGVAIQSEMRLSAPDELVFSYTRAMMGFLLFQPAPAHLLMVGLGGGSMAKFCYRHLPDTRITVLELDADVIALRDQFLIPPDDARFRIIHADAADFMESARQDVDALLLDGFGPDGLPPELCSAQFYALCRRALNPRGVLVANIIDRDPRLPSCIAYLHAEFGPRVCWCRAEGGGNRIVFAVNGASDGEGDADDGNECRHAFRPQLLQRAQASGLRSQLNLPQLVERLRCRHS
ncbi:fused MFS/spermidine synthase [Herminiimonas sp. CN]|uniref:fused MFS/spermidine synthase n=1 Tax=Herminiimonas sp. CN TaxID=1349818 RepID=UPI00047318A5|nr:fused MFS/spermidine synthase [Herminiimonas sp. CN]